MKILFDNIAKSASLSAITPDPNYPVNNIISVFLKKRFQSINLTDTVTAIWASPVTIDTIHIGYTNAVVTVKIYLASVLLDTLTGDEVYHFAPTSVDEVEFELVAGEVAYLGGIGIGSAYAIDPPESFWDETFDDRSIVSESDGGQVLQEYTAPLRVYQFSVPTLTRDEARACENLYIQCGRGRAIWLDPETDDLPPLYCSLVDALTINKNKRQYTARLNFREAR